VDVVYVIVTKGVEIGYVLFNIMWNAGDGQTTDVDSGFERRMIERGEAEADFQMGSGAANPLDNFPGEAGAVFKRATEWAASRKGREHFVAEIAVAVFDVHKMKSDAGGDAGDGNVGVDQPSDVIVRD